MLWLNIKVGNFFPLRRALSSRLQSWKLLASADFGRTLKLETFDRPWIWATGFAFVPRLRNFCPTGTRAHGTPYDQREAGGGCRPGFSASLSRWSMGRRIPVESQIISRDRRLSTLCTKWNIL